MSKEIKFRFWVDDKNVMIDWETAKKNCDRLSLLSLEGFTPMQYTGLKDKNGKEIYEGDVVKYISNGILQYREVYWDSDMCGYLTGNTHFDNDMILGFGWMLTNGTVEVIGNIYENPEYIENELQPNKNKMQ